MEIVVGSNNPTKLNACEVVFPEFDVRRASVASNVSPQPLSDEETRQGAINRAVASAKLNDNGLGIGLEGGVMIVENELYLCNWGALVSPKGKIYTASGARIVLPQAFLKDLKYGKELGDLMTVFAQKENVRSKEGAVGIFTNDVVDRSEMFTHVVKLLRGQWEYNRKGAQI
ncbi:DUF84 family protein [Oceanobacillus sp. CAU 1775]